MGQTDREPGIWNWALIGLAGSYSSHRLERPFHGKYGIVHYL